MRRVASNLAAERPEIGAGMKAEATAKRLRRKPSLLATAIASIGCHATSSDNRGL
jgi:hypothetical protein